MDGAVMDAPPSRDGRDTFMPEDEALDAVRRHAGPLLVDLDETLYLRNSTEDFIDSAAPGALALLALTALAVLKPWRFTGGDPTRDVWRVGLILVLFPWTLARWRRRVRANAPGLLNEPLAAILRARTEPFTIATLGFGPVVRPLVAALGFADRELIACRAFSRADRLRGKLELVRDRWGPAGAATAMVVTDSTDDARLLAVCGTPVLARWRDARWVPALRSAYLPGTYLTFVKRPGTSPLRALLVEDLPVWLLATLPVSATLPGVVGMLFLFVSFWSIYEIGYIENDAVAARFETDATLSDTYRAFDPASVGVRPWFYGLGAGAAAIALLQDGSWREGATGFGLWLAVLVAVRAWYRVYNLSDKNTRAWLYVGLQMFRAAAFVAVVPANEAGLYACLACVAVRSQLYMVYRHLRTVGIRAWPQLRERLLRFVYYVAFLLVGLGVHLGQRLYLPRSGWLAAGLLAGWFALVARHDLRAVARAARRLDRAP